MSRTLPAWDEKAYREVATPGFGYLEGQWGSVATGIYSNLQGQIIEIYRNGSFLFATDGSEVLVTDSDPRLFEVDLPPERN